ncbi:MAG: YtxH domain-containing protein [Bacteroidota bacterium]
MKDQAKIIAALLLGAAAGAALGILLAPDSGEETRNDIADRINGTVDKAKSQALSATGNAKEYGTSLVDKLKSKYNSAVHDLYNYRDGVTDEASKVTEAAQDHVSHAKAKVKHAADDVNDAIQEA